MTGRPASPAFFVFIVWENPKTDVSAAGKGTILQVIVRENNIEQAIRVLKKKMQREGVFREMRARSAYEKPSERRARQKAEGIRRVRKMAKKKAQREGLIPAAKKPARPTMGRGRPTETQPQHSEA
jgi:small subunit ribosomal protein S21